MSTAPTQNAKLLAWVERDSKTLPPERNRVVRRFCARVRTSRFADGQREAGDASEFRKASQ